MHEAILESLSDREPGPVWIDIPLDYQWDETHIKQEDFKELSLNKNPLAQQDEYEKFYDLMDQAISPLFVLGYGVRLSNSLDLYKKRFIE